MSNITNTNKPPISNQPTNINSTLTMSQSIENVITSNTNDQYNDSQSGSYAKALKRAPNFYSEQYNIPTKEHGIILSTIDGIKLEEYIESIAALVEPENIIFASRLSHDRVCLYLKTKEQAEELTDKYNTIIIQNNEILLRPLITKAKKFFLSNVPPIIPNAHLHQQIEQFNIKITSAIQYNKIGCTNPRFSHILSNRRTFYGTCESKLPESIVIDFEDEHYRLFITTELKKCSSCLKFGHLIDNCPTKQTVSMETEENFSESLSQNNQKQNRLEPHDIIEGPRKKPKTETSKKLENNPDFNFISNLDEQEIAKYLDSCTGPQIASVQILKDFFQFSMKTKVTRDEILSFIRNIDMEEDSFIQLLDNIYPLVSKTLKGRITRIQRKIKNLSRLLNDSLETFDPLND